MPGGHGGPLPLGRGGRLAGRGQLRLGLGQPTAGLFVPLAELGVARVEPIDLRLELLVLLLCRDRALLRLVPGQGEAVDLGLRGRGPGARRVDLPVEPREPFAPVGDGPCRVLQAPLLGGELAFEVGAVGDGVVEGVLGGFEGGFEFGLLLPDARGLPLHVLGVASAPLLGRGGPGAGDAGVRE